MVTRSSGINSDHLADEGLGRGTWGHAGLFKQLQFFRNLAKKGEGASINFSHSLRMCLQYE